MTVSELITELIELSRNGYSRSELIYGSNVTDDETVGSVYVDDDSGNVILD
jgi:hypothetical protein